MDRFLETHVGRQTTELHFYKLLRRLRTKSSAPSELNCDQTGRGVHVLAIPEQQVSRWSAVKQINHLTNELVNSFDENNDLWLLKIHDVSWFQDS